MARPPGGPVPVQRRVRHPAGLLLELRGRSAIVRRRRMALEAGRFRRSRRVLPGHAVRHSAQPALAGAQGPRGRSPHGAGRDRRREHRTGTGRTSSRPSIWSTAQGHEPLFQAKYTLPIFLAISIAHVQPALRHQRDSLLPERHLREGRLQQGLRRSAGRGHRRHQPACSP